MLTMQDIAARAGVSRSAVSHVLNDRDRQVGLRPDTRERILNAIRELGYCRNEAARQIRSGKSRIIAFISSNIPEYYVSSCLSGVLEEANRRNFLVKVCMWQYGSSRHSFGNAVEQSLQTRPLGLLCRAGRGEMPLLERLTRLAGTPVINLDSSAFLASWLTRIRSDDAEGCRLAVAHLRKLGHRRIALVGYPLQAEFQQVRIQGFRLAMRQARLAIARDYWGKDGCPLVPGQLPRLYAQFRSKAPTAFFCVSDYCAAEAVRELRRIGINVPRDVAVVGYGDLPLGRYCDPPLTTVWQPFEEIGREAVRLVELFAGKKNTTAEYKGKDIVLPVRLIVRESSGPAPK